MDRLLIVDDEEIERESIANLINWQRYGIEMVGTAWNGVEGLEKIKQLHPDIVLVDIKMPVMNGIEMIHQAQPFSPGTIFVILSGYGEYEFTSQAMQEGIRHYILKPCDEEKILSVIEKVRVELEERRASSAQAHSTRLLLPRAREQIFRDLLLGRDPVDASGPQQLIRAMGGLERSILMTAFRLERGFSYHEQFVIDNMMNDLLPGGTLLLSAGIRKDIFLLIDGSAAENLEGAVSRLRQEFRRLEASPIHSAASRTGTLQELPQLYEQVEELLYLADIENLECLLQYDRCAAGGGQETCLVDYQAIRSAVRYDQILFELQLALMKMKLRGKSRWEQERYFTVVWKMLEDGHPAPEMTLGGLADALLERKDPEAGKESRRGRNILLAAYQHINDPGISLQILAKEYLFMNEEYLGRTFVKLTGMRFSAYIESRRIEQAVHLLRFQPDLKISELAQLVGYPADGQYFSKVFHKIHGMTPKEFRSTL